MESKAFVIMPFGEAFDLIYNNFIKEVLEKIGYVVFRADDLLNQQNILQDIIESINNSNLIIADLTGSNPNVYYEVGIAHTLGKNVVLLTQNINDLPFDLKSYRVILYNTHFAKIPNAMDQLTKIAQQILDNKIAFGSPVTDYLINKNTYEDKTASIKEKSFDQKIFDEDELGFFDHITNVEEGFEELAAIINNITQFITFSGTQARRITKEMDNVNKNPSQGSSKYLQKYLKKEGKELSKYCSDFPDVNNKYSSKLSEITTSLEYALRFEMVKRDSNKEEKRKLFGALDNIESTSLYAKESFINLYQTLQSIPNMEKTYNRAKNSLSIEVERFVANIEQTISTVSRIRNLGKDLL